jgi:very-short-patch-repair endonuclease
VIRFSNQEVIGETDKVLGEILNTCEKIVDNAEISEDVQ